MIRVRAVTTGVGGSPWYSNFYFDGSLLSDATAAATNVRNLLSSFATTMYTGLQIQLEPFVPEIDPETGDITGGFTVTPGAAIACSNVNDLLPTATQALVTLRTGVYTAGREIKGKIYLGGWTESISAIGVPTPTGRGIIDSAFATFLAASGPDPVVWSRKNGTIAPVQSATTNLKWAVLRSRRD